MTILLKDIKKILKIIINISRKIFTPIATGAIIFIFIQNESSIYNLFKNTKKEYLLVSILILSCANFLVPFLTVTIFKHLNERINYNLALFIHFSKLPARYLPGGIWQTVAKLTDYKEKGASLSFLKKLTGYEIISSLASAFALAVLLKIAACLAASSIIGLILLSFSATILLFFKNRLSSYQHWFVFIASYLPVWTGYSTAFVFFFKAFDLGTRSDALSLASSYLLSWIVGFLAVFAPQGIGITEIVFLKMEKIELHNISTTISILFSFRFIILISDTICWIYSFIHKKLFLRN